MISPSHGEAGGQQPPRVEIAPTRDFTWMTERSGYAPLPDGRGIVALRGAQALGMVVYDGFTATLAQVHVALATPMAARHLLRPAFEYPFLQLGLLALATMLDSRNERAVALALGAGFLEAGRIQDGVDVGSDLVLYQLRRERCRFLSEVH